MAKEERMQDLVRILNEHSYSYYTLDNPTISDKEYDALYDELKALEDETGTVLPDSPTLRVGGETLAVFKKHRHAVPLWSLDKAKTLEEVEAWETRAKKLMAQASQNTPLEYTLEYKFDGLTINLTYDQGQLVMAATRGDGQTGEEILEQVKNHSQCSARYSLQRKNGSPGRRHYAAFRIGKIQ